MIKKPILFCCYLFVWHCNTQKQNNNQQENANTSFSNFELRFLDAYWKENLSAAIFACYGKYMMYL